MSGPVASDLLPTALAAAVPLWIERLRHTSFEDRQARAHEAADVVASKGDIIQFKGEKPGQTAEAFNRLAEGLACLAYSPGGVKFMGLHFEAKGEDCP